MNVKNYGSFWKIKDKGLESNLEEIRHRLIFLNISKLVHIP
ncbi:MAG: hypothetical protein PHQ15_08175 [Methanosarcina sp.]|nr:hypothetical protein [Methanosarcina sp.]MDD4620782.1 hypothetical protein [Methanosarcina sp.]